jgi:hypothetical protein
VLFIFLSVYIHFSFTLSLLSTTARGPV